MKKTTQTNVLVREKERDRPQVLEGAHPTPGLRDLAQSCHCFMP